MKMKVLAFVDTHGSKKALKVLLERTKKVDMIVCAGDISDWGRNVDEILKKFEKTKTTTLIVHGNHEFEDELREVCKKFKFVHYIHKGSYQLGKHVFFGYGGGGFAMQNKEFEKISKRFKKSIKKDSKIILVTHGPPFGTKLDLLPDIGYRGCASIRKFIEEVKPLLHVCGHLHENAGNKDVVGKTLVINPGPTGRILKI